MLNDFEPKKLKEAVKNLDDNRIFFNGKNSFFKRIWHKIKTIFNKNS